MKKTACSLALSVLLASVPLTQAQAKETTLRIGTEGAYPPFNYYTADGQLAGFDIDIGNALCEKMNAKCTFVAQDWEGIIPALLAGKYDTVIASMFITEKRKQRVDFTDPYQKSAMTFVVPKDSDINDFSPQALAGKTIGAQGSSTQGDYLTALYPDSDVRLYPTQDAVNLDLVSGRLDAQVGDIVPMMSWVKDTQDGQCCKLAGNLITDPTYVGEGVGIALRQEDDALRHKLNKALADIVADGTYQAINDKYFSVNILTLE
ncbi:ABC transporter substrate-binding protein [Photobacterium atrarenae]|uniref:ABC transporter substrate-binding protein n=1 Tax=Photobacterium atrarenae TaxID=865757 RepID=A0ABY5GNT0_9GAMM|nr:ABC transporter substrate-binding protein [Photobacterium atrarenae]UTV30416.1 ABC transporter substrate-binding protein [Photobacterium atrarenae]